MATVTGSLVDFTDVARPGLVPVIVFTPSGPAVAGPYLHFSVPIDVTPAADGTFTAFLTPNAGLRPINWYTVSVKWLDSAGNFIGVDFFPWQLIVPPAGGIISDLLAVSLNVGMVWVTSDGSEPAGSKSGDLIFNTTTDDLTKIL